MHFRDKKSRNNETYHRENKFHQYDRTHQLLLGSVAQIWKKFCGSQIAALSFLNVFSVYSGLNPQEEMPDFLEFSTIAENDPSRAGGLSITFPELPTVPRAVGGKPESRLSIPLELRELLAVSGS